MSKYKGITIVYDYWIDFEDSKIYAIVEWTQLQTDKKHSNVILVSKDYHGDKKTI